MPVFTLNRGSSFYQEADFETLFNSTSPNKLILRNPPYPGKGFELAIITSKHRQKVHFLMTMLKERLNTSILINFLFGILKYIKVIKYGKK